MPRHRQALRSVLASVVALAAVFVSAPGAEPAVAAPGAAASVPTGFPSCPAPEEYPPAESGYHGYDEVMCTIHAIAQAHPRIVRVGSIGTSFEGRDIPVVRISDNVAIDEGEPEVLLDGLHHAREHLSGEMALSVIDLLTGGYGTDARITAIVDSRVTWVVPVVNPDGYVYELSGPPEAPYLEWRKNRQPNGPPDSGIPTGTDLNRNYAFRWGGPGSSADPGSVVYRGAAPFSAPEAAAMRDFILGRVIDGRQRITSHISLHTSGEQILYPYSHTLIDLPAAMTALDHEVFVAMANTMALGNGYTPMQASDLYLHSGSQQDWAYATQRIFSFTFELYPDPGMDIDPVPDEDIARETERNHEAILFLLEHADCPYRAIGKVASHCGPLFDDLEAERGWKIDPSGTDTATAGVWARGHPESTASRAAKQLGDAWSGRYALVTGLALLGCARCNDVDGGVTRVRSPMVRLPAVRASRLRLRYFLGHGGDADATDGLRIAVIDGLTRTVVLRMAATPGVHAPAAWRGISADLGPWAGKKIRIQLEARDSGTDSLLEAGVDEVRITAP
jgi:hypothetical protein